MMDQPDDNDRSVKGLDIHDHFTMAEAATLKDVSYQTVSRAVRQGRLAVRRLGRMALISAGDLQRWEPMRDRAPRRYRSQSNHTELPIVDQPTDNGLELAQRVSSLQELFQSGATELPHGEFMALLCDRLAETLKFQRVALWRVDWTTRHLQRVASFGPPLSSTPSRIPIPDGDVVQRTLEMTCPTYLDHFQQYDWEGATYREAPKKILALPLRIAGEIKGYFFCDYLDADFSLNQTELDLAQLVANQAALALERADLRAAERLKVAQMEGVLADMTGPVFGCDQHGYLTFANASARKLLGIACDTGGQSIRELLEDVDRRDIRDTPISVDQMPIVQALAGNTVQEYQFEVARDDGERRLLQVSARPVIVDGHQRGAISVAIDLTTERAAIRQAAERLEALRASTARAEAVADISVAVLNGSDLQTVLLTAIERLTILSGGDSGSLYLKEPNGSMAGYVSYGIEAPPRDHFVPDAQVHPATMEAVATGRSVFFTRDETLGEERQLLERLGITSTTVTPLVAGGELIGLAYVNFTREVPRPRPEDLHFASSLAGQCAVAIEKARLLSRSEGAHRHLLTTIDQLSQAVIICEAPSGKLVLANQAAESFFGSPPVGDNAAIAGLGDAEGELIPDGQQPLQQTLRDGERRLGDALTVQKEDGSQLTLLANHTPVFDAGGRLIGGVAIFQDVAQLQAIDRANDELMSIVAHELRNPITSLRGNLQLLQRRARKQASQGVDLERLDALLSQTDRMAELVSRLLDISRAELGRLEINPVELDAADLVRDAVTAAAGLSKVHTFVAAAPETLPATWDSVRIDQVLTNLLSNAARYTPGGEVNVTLRALSAEQVEIQVRDHGPGIPDSVRAHLFERFFRLGGRGRETADTGLGLGLYISRRIAVAHGGTLTVEDAPGGGALFILRLPAHVPDGKSRARTSPTTG